MLPSLDPYADDQPLNLRLHVAAMRLQKYDLSVARAVAEMLVLQPLTDE
jgi:hypothetical protein